MTTSNNKLNGWPTRDGEKAPGQSDFQKGQRLNGFVGGVPKLRGEDTSKARPIPGKPKDPTTIGSARGPAANPALEQKLIAAEGERDRLRFQRALPKFYETYGVEPLVKVPAGPGKPDRLLSPTCQKNKEIKFYWLSDEEFVAHVVKVHGTPAKHAAWAKVKEEMDQAEEAGAGSDDLVPANPGKPEGGEPEE